MMKKIFLFLLLIISFVSYGQTYNPANFTVSNKSYGVAQAVPTDARSQFYDATNFVMRDYQSTTEVNSYLNLSKYRTGHFLIYIHNGGSLSSGVWTGGTTDIYIYKDGVADGNLVPLFTNTTLSNTGSGFRIVKPISGYDYPLRSLASSNTIIWDSTSNSNSLTGKVDTSLIVTINRLSDTAASIRLAISAGGGGITTLTGDVTASGTGSVAATISNNAVSNAKFRQSAALSVVGRTSNSTGNVADISAATSGHVLRRNGTTLDFGTIDSVSVPLLHSEAYYNTKYPAIGSDSVYVKAATNTGTSIFFIDADTLKLKRLQAGTNVTLTSNADSSITISSSGGGATPAGSNYDLQYKNASSLDASTTVGSVTVTSAKRRWLQSRNLLGTYQIIGPGYNSNPSGDTAYDGTYQPNGEWIPSFAFAGNVKDGLGIDNVGRTINIKGGGILSYMYWEGGVVGDASILRFNGTNRGSIEGPNLVMITDNSRFEEEGGGSGRFIFHTPYVKGSANSKTTVWTNDIVSPTTPLGVMPRYGVPAFSIIDSTEKALSWFDANGKLKIGDTSANNAGIVVATASSSLGHDQIQFKDLSDLTNKWGIRVQNAYTNMDLHFTYNNAEQAGFTNLGNMFVGLHVPSARLSVKSSGNTSSSYALNIQNSSNTGLFKVRDDGRVYIGSFTDNGSFTLQNTGGLYQQGVLRLGGTRIAGSNDVNILVKGETDSSVAQLNFPITQNSYTPTKTDVTNVASSSVTTAYYSRTGNMIEVWGEITIDPTATGDTQVDLSLPISSAMSNSYDLSGSAVTYDVQQSARIYYSGGKAVIRLNASVDASSHVYSYRYVYYYFAP